MSEFVLVFIAIKAPDSTASLGSDPITVDLSELRRERILETGSFALWRQVLLAGRHFSSR